MSKAKFIDWEAVIQISSSSDEGLSGDVEKGNEGSSQAKNPLGQTWKEYFPAETTEEKGK